MKLVDRSKDNRRFIVSEEAGNVVFRITDYEGAKFFTMNIDEIRSVRDTLNEFVKKYDKFMMAHMNRSHEPSPTPIPPQTPETSVTELPGADSIGSGTSIFDTQPEEKNEETRSPFEFY
jgi:hypothetical protein